MTEKRTEPAQDVIAGRNAVKEALRSARPIESILVARGARNGTWETLFPRRRPKEWP